MAWSWAMAAALAIGGGPAGDESGTPTFTFHHEGVLGTFLELAVQATDAQAAHQAETRVLAEVDRLASIFSGYDPASEFSRWLSQSGTPVRVSPELFTLLAAADDWRTASDGAFDPRVEALSRLWHAAEQSGTAPTEDQVRRALELMATHAWRLDPARRAAVRTSACPLSLDALATGTIVDHAAAAARSVPGVSGVLLNLGGDLIASGVGPALVAIPDPASGAEYGAPLALIRVAGRAVTTSGRSDRDFLIDGRKWSHLFDPRTGRPSEEVASATVVAPTCEAADALATALAVLPVAEGLALAAREGAECLIVRDNGRTATSAGWDDLLAASDETPTANQPDDSPASEFEMLVSLEINRPPGATRYRRPYLAVWIEDPEGKPVRTIALLVSFGGAGPSWVSDLKRWYRSDRERQKTDKTDRLYAVGKATRPPGRFDILWDGKDDRGVAVPVGVYTLFIEAVREHGTYQLIRVPLELAGKPFTLEAEGGTEIKSARVEYRAKVETP